MTWFVDPAVLLAEDALLSIDEESVAVTGFFLDTTPSIIDECRNLLSEDELQRAHRFVHPNHRDRYVIAHGVTRHLLARYCQVAPQALQFETTHAGKPSLVPEMRRVSFNLSHSEDRAILAISGAKAVGADLEQRRLDISPLSIAGHYFFGAEHAAIQSAHTEMDQRNLFLKYWVAKEAVLKGEGIGLGFPLDRFQITFTDIKNANIVSFDETQLASDWSIKMIPCDEGWFAAVAARGTTWRITQP